jgi:cell division protein FtsZ
MALHLSAPRNTELKPRITVFGVGGAGGNAVNNMIDAGVQGVDFIVANTDAQALTRSKADKRLQLGLSVTEGLGAGARPEIGEQAADESLGDIHEHLDGAHMVFITAGMGGGTGTGAAPVIARAAREKGILTVGVVTKPFHFEGGRRMKLAEAGIAEMQKHVDTLIIIPNQNLFRVANERTTFAEAFSMADQVLCSGVRGITDLMVMPGLINLDFSDVRTVMSEMGKAMMGTGEAAGERRAIEAAHAAVNNPLLDEVSLIGAKGVLINITGGFDLGLHEVDAAASEIKAGVDPDANIIVGTSLDESMEGRMRVSVVATGIDSEAFRRSEAKPEPAPVAQAPSLARPGVRTPLTTGWRPPAMAPRAPEVTEAMADIEDEPATPVQHMHAHITERFNEPEHQPETDTAHAMHHAIDDAVASDDHVAIPARPTIRPQIQHPGYAPMPQTRREETAHEPIEHSAPKSFSIFGWGRKDKAQVSVQQAPVVRPVRAPAPDVRVHQSEPGSDMFQGRVEDDHLDIPAFLRRQAN